MSSLGEKLKPALRALRDLSPNCREASRLQSKALDGALPFGKRLGLRMHLALCRWCRRYGKHIRVLRILGRTAGSDERGLPPGSLSSSARERIKSKLRE